MLRKVSWGNGGKQYYNEEYVVYSSDGAQNRTFSAVEYLKFDILIWIQKNFNNLWFKKNSYEVEEI